MRNYWKHFRIPFIIVIVLALVFGGITIFKGSNEVERTNDEPGEQRVFDYADVLSDSEEKKLEKLIAKKQKQLGGDIVLMTIEQRLQDESDDYEYPEYYYSEVNLDLAEDIYDELSFGYDVPGGDGFIYLDNYYEQEDGYQYSSIFASGECYHEFTDSEMDDVIADTNDDVEDDPYDAYCDMINQSVREMSKGGIDIPVLPIIVIVAIITIVFYARHGSKAKAKKTTAANTYIANNAPRMNQVQDIAYDTKVVTRRIESSSGGGRGGGSRSGGGSRGGRSGRR